MCGICGFIGMRDDELLMRMMERMRHRGPDQEGRHLSDPVSLGHRRLSIIDLVTGGQPLYNEDHSIVVVFNGEIYNFNELRRDLEKQGHRFSTRTDTEVIVHAYEEYGEACVEHFNGEFAFAIWDDNTQTLFLARDRLGIRPLFYSIHGQRLAFASELRALMCWEEARGPLRAQGLSSYLSLRYLPASTTLVDGVEQLAPGTSLLYQQGRMRTTRYWFPKAAHLQSRDWQEWVDGFRELFTDSVRLRMRSDVPIGAYLSGGIDSASIVALMQRQTPLPVRTFTIGGFGSDVDESDEAAALARHIGTQHTELTIDPGQFELLPQVAACMSSPIGDAITLPTWLLAKATAERVKVVLSGEGADEILAGYIHHLALKNGHDLQRAIPDSLLRLSRWMLHKVPDTVLDRFFPYPAALGNKGKDKGLDFLDALAHHDVGRQYLNLACVFQEREKRMLLAGGHFTSSAGEEHILRLLRGALTDGSGFFDSLLRLDISNWLADYTLAKQDALSMAHSLEVRVPFLDHRLVEYALALPAKFKIRGMRNKIVLREAMQGILPKRTVHAPKKAFYIPFERCFGPAFDDFVRDILLSRRCLERGIFNTGYLQKRLQTVRSRELIDNKQTMALLILELWLRAHVDNVVHG
jgi:asparagine synthase (glutamine-hydrolysing)